MATSRRSVDATHDAALEHVQVTPRHLGFVPALNGLRGVAILAVTAHHFFGLSGGFYGVDLFFVLSGFLITTLLLEEFETTGRISLRGFYARRARRLMPALGMFLLVAAVLGLNAYGAWQIAGAVASALLYSLNIVGVAGHPLLLAGPLGHLWSLSQEEQFYLLWPVLLIVGVRRMSERRLALVLAGVFVALVAYRIGVVLSGASWTRVYFAPDTHADGLVIGCLAAMLWRRGLQLPGTLAWPALAGLAAAIVLGQSTVNWSAFGLPAVEIASAVLVLVVLQRGRLELLMSWRPLSG